MHGVRARLTNALRAVRSAGRSRGPAPADKDEPNTKVHTSHYRRFQNAEEFRDSLVSTHGFEVLHFEEGTGLSPYKGEDPVLCRVVARR